MATETDLDLLAAAVDFALEWHDLELRQRLHAILNGEYDPAQDALHRPGICGVVSLSGPNGEPLACGLNPGHLPSPHAWATLSTTDALRSAADALAEACAAADPAAV